MSEQRKVRDVSMVDPGPLVIGGLGGSGTRAVAFAAARLGVDLGTELNDASDDTLFTLCVKRPRWLLPRLTAERPNPEVLQALEVYMKLRTGSPLDQAQTQLLTQAVADLAVHGFSLDSPPGPPDAAVFRLAAEALAATPSRPPWGWKEPNSHLVLPELVAALPGLVYVHVVRHPLDMACSDNHNQRRLWGSTVGAHDPRFTPQEAQVLWWLRSTEQAVERGASLGERFLLLSFEDFCADPSPELHRLSELLGLAGAGVDEAAKEVALPSSSGRWRQYDWSDFDRELMDQIARHGYAL